MTECEDCGTSKDLNGYQVTSGKVYILCYGDAVKRWGERLREIP